VKDVLRKEGEKKKKRMHAGVGEVHVKRAPRPRCQATMRAGAEHCAAMTLLIVGAILGWVGTGNRGGALVRIGAAKLCSRSLRESDGWYCEPEKEWGRKVDIARRQMPKQCTDRSCFHRNPHRWYWHHYEQEWSCREERIGDIGPAGKWVCDIDLLRAQRSRASSGQPCLVYTIGFNGSYSFETALHERLPECKMVVLDASEQSQVANAPPFVLHKPWEVARGQLPPNSSRVYPLQTVMQKLHHGGMEIDVLRIELYGHEYDLFAKLAAENFMPFRQILLKLHDPKQNSMLFLQLRRFGFVVAHKEVFYPNILVHQFVLIRLAPTFFTEIVPDPLVAELVRV